MLDVFFLSEIILNKIVKKKKKEIPGGKKKCKLFSDTTEKKRWKIWFFGRKKIKK